MDSSTPSEYRPLRRSVTPLYTLNANCPEPGQRGSSRPNLPSSCLCLPFLPSSRHPAPCACRYITSSWCSGANNIGAQLPFLEQPRYQNPRISSRFTEALFSAKKLGAHRYILGRYIPTFPPPGFPERPPPLPSLESHCSRSVLLPPTKNLSGVHVAIYTGV